MKKIIITAVMMSVVTYATYDSSAIRPHSKERIADLLLNCDMVIVSKSNSYWMRNKDNIESATFEVQDVLARKYSKDITQKYFQNNSFTLFKEKDRNDFPLYKNVQYIFFLKLPTDAQKDDQKVGKLIVLDGGAFMMTEIENIPGLKERVKNDEKYKLLIDSEKSYYKTTYGSENKNTFKNVLINLINIMTVDSKDDVESVDDELYKSNLDYILQFGPYKKFINIAP